jgi:TP901-1 family phage major tail protein
MATTGKVNGTNIKAFIGGTAISFLKDCSISLNGATIDVSNKDSAGWKEVIRGQKSWTISANASFAFDASYGLSALFSAWNAGTLLALTMGTTDAADDIFSGNAIVTNISLSGGTEDESAYSIEFEGSGALAFS